MWLLPEQKIIFNQNFEILIEWKETNIDLYHLWMGSLTFTAGQISRAWKHYEKLYTCTFTLYYIADEVYLLFGVYMTLFLFLMNMWVVRCLNCSLSYVNYVDSGEIFFATYLGEYAIRTHDSIWEVFWVSNLCQIRFNIFGVLVDSHYFWSVWKQCFMCKADSSKEISCSTLKTKKKTTRYFHKIHF